MEYARCGSSGLQLPRISLGLWQNFGHGAPQENVREMILNSFDAGITHFDLANNYGPPPGAAEENFGRLLATDLKHHRDELVISTKAGYRMWPGPYGEWGSRKYLLASLDQSLARMGLDYVDVFYSHRFDPETPLEETMTGARQRRSQRPCALRRHFILRAGTDPTRDRHIAGAQDAVRPAPAFLFDVQSMGRERTAGTS